MTSNEKRILEEYRKNTIYYEKVEQIASTQIEEIVEKNKFFVMEVSHRSKSIESLENKLKNKIGRYKTIYDITDLCGVRVICYFADTVDRIAEVIREKFIVDERNSVDKRAMINEKEFGYLSLHYICSLPESTQYPKEVSRIKFEIQIRTVLQHAWAEIEHDLGYKSSFGVPRTIRRDFSRLAGLLEIADDLFISLRDDSRSYTAEIRNKIINNDADDVPLDRVSLNEYVRINSTLCDLVDAISKETGATVEDIPADVYIKQFEYLGIDTIGDLSRMMDLNKEKVFESIVNMIHELQLDIVSSNMVLRYLCYCEIVRRKLDRSQVEDFISISVSNRKTIDAYVDIVMQEMGKM